MEITERFVYAVKMSIPLSESNLSKVFSVCLWLDTDLKTRQTNVSDM